MGRRKLKPADFAKDSVARRLKYGDIEYNSTLHKLINVLNSSTHFMAQMPPESIMNYGSLCNCDNGRLCEHRLQYIVNFLKDIIEEKGT